MSLLSSVECGGRAGWCNGTAPVAIPVRLIYCLVITLISLLLPGYCLAKPFVPSDGNQLLLQPDYTVSSPAQDLPVNDDVAFDDALNQARSYLIQAPTHSSTDYYQYAKIALEPWWQKQIFNHKQQGNQLRLLRAQINQHQHRFDAALEDLQTLLGHQPQHTQARLMRAAIYLAMGEPTKSRADCLTLTLSIDSLLVMNCVAQAEGVMGNARLMQTKIQQRLSNLDVHDLDVEISRQLLVTLAELSVYAAQPDLADQYYKQALQLQPNDRQLLMRYSEFLLLQQRFKPLYQLTDEDDSVDTLLFKVAAGYKTNPKSIEPYLSNLAKEAQIAKTRNDIDSKKWLAMYYLYVESKPVSAVQYAQDNWQIQKTMTDTMLLLQALEREGSESLPSALRQWLGQNRIETRQLQLAISRWGGFKEEKI